ncbi:response regulator [Pseudoalteromonas sp. K222D]|uniref:response regulator n=1 Tax=unclassified Pseudoalteromonas TaxID=194690 RepID=UPI001AD70E6F|nr:response regulator [Pseudoalteromonas sp. K222D]MBO7927895.1 response regulator [Pseudoalteromonas sp. K222D]
MKFLHNKRILVIDDSNLILSAIKLMLLNAGAQQQHLVLAKNTQSTISACQARAFDFIIFDYNLGAGADGLQLLAYLTLAQLIPKSCVVFIVTAEQSRRVVHGFSEWQPDGYFVKPFNINNMLPRMIACYQKKYALKNLEECFLKYGFNEAKQQLNKLTGFSYYIDYEIQLLTWDRQTDAAKKRLNYAIAQGDENARLNYANWLLVAGDIEQAITLIEPLLTIPRFRLAALELKMSAHLAQGALQQADNLIMQMNAIAPDNAQRLLIQFNIAVILENNVQMQRSITRYQRLTQQLSWLNIDCHFNVLRCLLSQIESLDASNYGSEFKRLEKTYLEKRAALLKNARAAQLREVKQVLDARFAICIGERQVALEIVKQYSDHGSYISLPFYCQLDIVHIYRRLALPLPEFITLLNTTEHSQHLLLQNTLRYTHIYQQQLEAQIRKIKAAEFQGNHMQATTLIISTIKHYGIDLQLAKLLIKGFTKAIPMNAPPEQLKYFYLLAKHTLTANNNQFENSGLYVKYCDFIESSISFLHADPLV